MSGPEESPPSAATSTAPAPAPARKAKRWHKFAALGFSVLLSCFVAEAFVLVLFGEQPKFPRHVVQAPWGLRYNEPSATYRHKSADATIYFRINAHGMRADRDFSHAKPPGVKRIVSLGDSFTVGYEVDLENCFSSVLESELRKDGRRVEVLNAGVSGFSNAEETLYLERELIRFAPDMVLLSFYSNDFEDNVRSDLFKFDGERLVPNNLEYVPAGGLGNYLNTSWFFNLLSERSNAFVFAKERITLGLKRRTVEKNQARVEQAGAGGPKRADYAERLTTAIFDRLYAFLHEKNIPLVIMSIPDLAEGKKGTRPEERQELVELFPFDTFDTKRPGLHVVSAKEWLDPHRKELLYWTKSHWHWTPRSHRIAGEKLAELVRREKLI